MRLPRPSGGRWLTLAMATTILAFSGSAIYWRVGSESSSPVSPDGQGRDASGVAASSLNAARPQSPPAATASSSDDAPSDATGDARLDAGQSAGVTSPGGGPMAPQTPRGVAIRWKVEQVELSRLRAAIDRAADYLIRNCREDGAFTYTIQLDREFRPRDEYNILRHAGAIYALACYQAVHPTPDADLALRRATRFLRNQLAPLEGHDELLAVWSRPDVTHVPLPVLAKLGGAGLALVALCHLEEALPGELDLDEARGLARFIRYMQKDDGSFYSRYIPEAGGRDDRLDSSYYPGEATLGMLLLYQRDPDPLWLDSARRAAAYLARRSVDQTLTNPDQWLLLAGGHLQRHWESVPTALPLAPVRSYLQRIGQDMLADQHASLHDSLISGCFSEDGQTCPTATRLEGLLELLNYLPAHDAALRGEVKQACRKGMNFLLDSQLAEGPAEGGFPRVTLRVDVSDARAVQIPREELREVRVDYVQHALNAMLRYEAQFDELSED